MDRPSSYTSSHLKGLSTTTERYQPRSTAGRGDADETG